MAAASCNLHVHSMSHSLKNYPSTCLCSLFRDLECLQMSGCFDFSRIQAEPKVLTWMRNHKLLRENRHALFLSSTGTLSASTSSSIHTSLGTLSNEHSERLSLLPANPLSGTSRSSPTSSVQSTPIIPHVDTSRSNSIKSPSSASSFRTVTPFRTPLSFPRNPSSSRTPVTPRTPVNSPQNSLYASRSRLTTPASASSANKRQKISPTHSSTPDFISKFERSKQNTSRNPSLQSTST